LELRLSRLQVARDVADVPLALTNAEIEDFLPDVKVWLALASDRHVHAGT